MIINTHLHKVESAGVLDKSSFSMANNAHAFQTMSDRLYSDKVTAVIREVTINAVDAHIESGEPDRPVELHLPTALEPYFHVRDFGPGLCHEDMMYLYTTYFASTKTGDNSNTGGFGLGCKAPFAYTSTFSVESTHLGVTRVYSALKGEDGKPEMNLLLEEDLGNADGLLVSLPVRSWDHSEFYRKAAKVLELIPAFTTNLSEFTAAKTTYVSKNSTWGLRDPHANDHVGHSRPRVIMGKVAYPVSMDESKLTDAEKSILKLPVDLFFDIGEVSVTPSRESLDMRKDTFAAIATRLSEVHTHIITSVKDEIEGARSVWYAKLALRDRLVDSSPYKPIIKTAIRQYFGKYSNFLLDGLSTDLDMRGFATLSLASRRYTIRNNKLCKLVMEEDRRSIVVETSEASIFYLHDGPEQPSRISKRIMDMLHTIHPSYNITLYLIIPEGTANQATRDRELMSLVDALGNPDIFLTSELPPVPKKPRAPRAPSDTCKFAWSYRGDRFASPQANVAMWAKVPQGEFDGDGPFYYVPLDHLECLIPTLNTQTLFNVWKALRLLRVPLGDDEYTVDSSSVLYGLNRQGVQRIQNNSSWINIFELLKATSFEPPGSYLQYRASMGLRQISSGMPNIFQGYVQSKLRGPLRAHIKGTRFHHQAVILRRLNQLISRLVTPTPVNTAWTHLLGFTGQEITQMGVPQSIKTLMDALTLGELTTWYPMISLADRYYGHQDATYHAILGRYISDQDRNLG